MAHVRPICIQTCHHIASDSSCDRRVTRSRPAAPTSTSTTNLTFQLEAYRHNPLTIDLTIDTTRMNTTHRPVQRPLRLAASKPVATRSCPTFPRGSRHQETTNSEIQPPNKRQRISIPYAEADTMAETMGQTCRGEPAQDLSDMPLDVLFEIFELVLPMDLLHLARTSKALRNLLLRRSAISIWRAAFLNLPLAPPPRPEELTEPRWASLLFETDCTVSFFCLVSCARVLNISISPT